MSKIIEFFFIEEYLSRSTFFYNFNFRTTSLLKINFKPDEFEHCFNWRHSSEKYFVAIFLRFQSFCCIKNYFRQFSEHFGGNQKLRWFCTKQSYFHIFSSALRGPSPSPSEEMLFMDGSKHKVPSSFIGFLVKNIL